MLYCIEIKLVDLIWKEPKLGCYSRGIAFIDKHMPTVCLVAITLQMTFIFLFLRYSKVDVKDK